MIRLCLFIFAFLTVSAAVLPAQVPDSVFKPAWGAESQVSLRSPFPLDLAAIARPTFDPEHPDTSLIRKFYDEFAYAAPIPFEAPLPAGMPTRHYWVLGDSGASEVYPHRVAGTIYISTVPEGWPLQELRYFGNLRVRAARRSVGESNFGFFSPTPVRVRSGPATIGGTVRSPEIRATLGGRRIQVTLDSIPTIRGRGLLPVRARAFEIPETRQMYLSIGWPDDDICAGQYVLYRVSSNAARPIATKFGPCGE